MNRLESIRYRLLLRIGRPDMKFVLVNDRTPFRQISCVLCCEPFSSGYLRDVRTRLCYCDINCYAVHFGNSVALLQTCARAS